MFSGGVWGFSGCFRPVLFIGKLSEVRLRTIELEVFYIGIIISSVSAA